MRKEPADKIKKRLEYKPKKDLKKIINKKLENKIKKN
jgi:hypothetical protein